jgi:hypothetical protein
MATFGKTTNGASNTLHNANRKILSQATLTEAALLTSMTIRARASTAGSKLWKGVIYSDVAGVPTNLLATTAEGTITGTTVLSYTANFAGEALVAGTYWVGWIHNGDATIAAHPYRDNTAVMAVSNTDTYADGPTSSAGTMAALAGPIDAFVTYTPNVGGGGTTGQIKVYNGTSFVAKPVKVWNGTTWVTKPLKRYNGSSWVATNY